LKQADKILKTWNKFLIRKVIMSNGGLKDFDWEYYLDKNTDLRRNGVRTQEQSLQHWTKYGRREKRVHRFINQPNVENQKVKIPIICGMATIKERIPALKNAVESLVNQVDELHIYQNGYKESLDFLDNKKIYIYSSMDTNINRGDAGKFYTVGNNDDCYYFSVDDDIIYPSDYVSKTIHGLNKYDDRVIVSYHGKILDESSKYHDKNAIVFHYRKYLAKDEEIYFPGTGVSCFRTKYVKINFNDFVYPNMADVILGVECRVKEIKCVCLAHKADWLSDSKNYDVNRSIYFNNQKNKIVDRYFKRRFFDENTPKIKVVIPYVEDVHLLHKMVESVKTQTYINIETIYLKKGDISPPSDSDVIILKEGQILPPDCIKAKNLTQFTDLMYCSGSKNYGDGVGPDFIQKLCCIRKIKTVSATNKANKKYCLAIGSILRFASENCIVWGSGFISSDDDLGKNTWKGKNTSKVYQTPYDILSVRGPKTRGKLIDMGIQCPEEYGDPLFVAPLVYNSKEIIRYDIGIIPHYIDNLDVNMSNLVKKLKNMNLTVKTIDILTSHNPNQLIDEIQSCKKIISSSLHGVIISMAYGKDTIFTEFSDKVVGGQFKFQDFFESLHIKNYNPTSPDSDKLLDNVIHADKNAIESLGISILNTCPFFTSNDDKNKQISKWKSYVEDTFTQ